MILYHGSNMAIDGIDLNRCRPYKDFGRGFYLTDIREQAQRMAARTARMFSGNPTLTMFEFDLEEAQSSELKVKVFKEPDWEWARFVMSNRDINTTQPCHDYDIVIGPVADDTIARLLRSCVRRFLCVLWNPPDRANADRTGDTPLAAQNLNTAGGDTPAFSGLRD